VPPFDVPPAAWPPFGLPPLGVPPLAPPAVAEPPFDEPPVEPPLVPPPVPPADSSRPPELEQPTIPKDIPKIRVGNDFVRMRRAVARERHFRPSKGDRVSSVAARAGSEHRGRGEVAAAAHARASALQR